MKRSFILIAVLLTSIIVLILIYSLYKRSVLNNLANENLKVHNEWTKVYDKIYDQNRTLIIVIHELQKSNSKICKDSSISERTIEALINKTKSDSNSCSDNYQQSQFEINKLYLRLLNCLKNDNTKHDTLITNLVKQIENYDSQIKSLKDNYNSYTISYNETYSTFPNFFIAKNNGLKRCQVFEINFGIENKEPSRKNIDLPEWAKNVDTL